MVPNLATRYNFTVEQDVYACSINAECLCGNSVLPDSYFYAATRKNGLDPERVILLYWNSHKETGPQWQQELRRLI